MERKQANNYNQHGKYEKRTWRKPETYVTHSSCHLTYLSQTHDPTLLVDYLYLAIRFRLTYKVSEKWPKPNKDTHLTSQYSWLTHGYGRVLIINTASETNSKSHRRDTTTKKKKKEDILLSKISL